ncbi:MAG: FN3 associated domain-containing protein, partial [bacterium]|nr:FN3 associated domain-containing protein [bacterium]
AVIEDGKLVVNTPYLGMTVRYTTDGSTPTEQSALWTAPVAVGDAKLIRVRAYYLGAESVATRLEVK